MPKIAITGKGGVGKTSFSSLLAYVLAEQGQKIYAIDADPNATLAHALGLPHELVEQITPIVEMADLIEERTGARPGQYGKMFKLNPRVDDLPETLSVEHAGVRLMVMGTVTRGGGGCACPENVLLRSLITHLLLQREDVVILDMVAGVEHLGRATADAVDAFVVVVEPGRRSIDTAEHIRKLAGEIGLNHIAVVGNKIRNTTDEQFLKTHLHDFEFLGFLPYDEALIEADLKGCSPFDVACPSKEKVEALMSKL